MVCLLPVFYAGEFDSRRPTVLLCRSVMITRLRCACLHLGFVGNCSSMSAGAARKLIHLLVSLMLLTRVYACGLPIRGRIWLLAC